MGDESLEMRPEDVLARRALPPEMVRDLLEIARLDSRTVKRIGEYLLALQGLTEAESIKEGVKNCLRDSDDDLAESIVATLLNLKPTDVARTVATVDRWRQSTEQRRELFTDELFASLDRNLQAIVADYLSVELVQKADLLLRAVGNEFMDIAYFCDMRPVFDRPRKKVEGFVTLANLRLKYVSQDGIDHACEVALTEEELRELIKTSEEALAKLEVLKVTSASLSQSIKR